MFESGVLCIDYFPQALLLLGRNPYKCNTSSNSLACLQLAYNGGLNVKFYDHENCQQIYTSGNSIEEEDQKSHAYRIRRQQAEDGRSCINASSGDGNLDKRRDFLDRSFRRNREAGSASPYRGNIEITLPLYFSPWLANNNDRQKSVDACGTM